MTTDAETKQRILQFIKRHRIGVIATASLDGKPEAAVVEFGETEKLELIIDMFAASRKCANMKQNPRVAFVIGWDEKITVQYEGVATELTGEDLAECKKIYFVKSPRAARWENRPGNTYFKITPTWIRYSDLGKDPWEIHEVRF